MKKRLTKKTDFVIIHTWSRNKDRFERSKKSKKEVDKDLEEGIIGT